MLSKYGEREIKTDIRAAKRSLITYDNINSAILESNDVKPPPIVLALDKELLSGIFGVRQTQFLIRVPFATN